MKMRDAFTFWTPAHCTDMATAGQVAVFERGTRPREAIAAGTGHLFSDGAAFRHIAEEKRFIESSRQALIHFVTMVVRDGIDPQAAHAALLDIDEYAESLSLDTPGAREGDLEANLE